MLYSVDSGKYVKLTPHQKEFNAWMKKLSSVDYQAVIDELNRKIDGSEINTSSFIPGSDWSKTVFQPIYFACDEDDVNAGLFFGLILFDLMIKRPECWGFGRYEKDGLPIRGMTYFLLDNPPPYE